MDVGRLTAEFAFLFRNAFHLVRRQAPLFIAGAVLVGGVLVGSASLLVYLRDRQLDDSIRGAQTLSYLLAEDVDRSLQSMASTVSAAVERLQSAGPRSVDDFNATAADKDVQAFLRGRLSRGPLLEGLALVAADGKLVYAAHGGGTYDERMSREYLKALRRAGPADVFLSAPLQTLDSVPGVGVSKRIAAPDGGFLGVASGFMTPAVFGDMFAKTVLGKRGAIELFRTDGTLVTRAPEVEFMFGADITGSAAYRQYIARGRDGVTHEKSAVDGADRIVAVAKSPNFPLATVVSQSTDEVLAVWTRQAEWIAGGVFALVLSIVAGLFMLADRINRLSEERERNAVRAQLAVQYERFNNAVHNIVQGLAMYDASSRLVACNKRYAEIYGLPPELIRPGVARKDILARRIASETSSQERIERDGSVTVVDELADGRIILQRSKKLADGGWVSTHEDITARRRAEEKIEELATKDVLTGLSNRFEFKQRLNQCLAEARRKVGRFAVFYLDLDHFKAINETLGHVVGDKLLQQVAARISDTVRTEDVVARLGGDEFAIIQRISSAISDPLRLAERLIAAIGEPYDVDGHVIIAGASVGISLAPGDGVDADELMRGADMALYQSKAKGRGAYTFFELSMDEQVRARRRMEDDLRAALAENQFHLHYQPVVSAADRRVNSFEALLRWDHPVRGAVPPAEFIPAAEEIGLIVPIGEWVAREACKEAAKWPEAVNIAINISAVQFGSPGLVEAISAAIRDAGIDGSRLIVEVTESVMIKDAEQATAILHALRRLGAKIAMDDFGTGYSSLSYLRRFPFDKIKIDRSFVSELDESDDAVEIIRATTSMAKALGMTTVAEGVETESQFAQLAHEGCSEIQGYLISRPLPPHDVLRLLGVEPAGDRKTSALRTKPTFAPATVMVAEKLRTKTTFIRNLARAASIG